MGNSPQVHIIMPVKDSMATAEAAIRAVVNSGEPLTVYDDFSSEETAKRLDELQGELGINVMHLNEWITHPSPNYRWILIDAQRKALEADAALLIVESDVCVSNDTFARMTAAVRPGVGMIAAVTHDENGKINFPYEYARSIQEDGVCKKRLSFCCTLLSNTFLQAYDFEHLDEKKNWYDVHISHMAQQLGFENILQVTNPVIHTPHSSRPWKRLKYTNPLLYYWRKLTQHRDKI